MGRSGSVRGVRDVDVKDPFFHSTLSDEFFHLSVALDELRVLARPDGKLDEVGHDDVGGLLAHVHPNLALGSDPART
jgi:hypothetical protein